MKTAIVFIWALLCVATIALAQIPVIDTSTPGGAFAVSIAQMARLSGATISLYGTGSCSIFSAVETLSYLSE